MTSTDVAVVGRGLIGSAAARHLAESGMSCTVIGRAEPDASADASSRAGWAAPFSSHFDEGRVTRIAGRTMQWAELAVRSIRRYPDIEARSGISFHSQAGLVVAVPTLDDWIDAGLIMGSDIRKVERAWVRSSTGIDIGNGLPIAYEGPPAGHINPRRLIAAQTKLSEAAGATVVDDVVTKVAKSNGGFEISGGWGTASADRVLLATGAFGRSLVDAELVLERRPRTVVLAEPMAEIERSTIPSLILADPPDGRLETIYLVPPMRFPDGRLCLKIGGTLFETRTIEDGIELTEWFCSEGYAPETDALSETVKALLPDVEFSSFTSRPCVVTTTPSDHPYIGFVDHGVGVAIGGNGAAAKSSDELGRLAASLFSEDGWTDPLDQDFFAPQLL